MLNYKPAKKLFLLFAGFAAASVMGVYQTGKATATTSSLFEDARGVTWYYELVTDDSTNEEEKVSIALYDRPADMTTIVVPSYEEVITASGATSNLDTYFLVDADTDYLDATYGATYPRTTPTSDITKIDMTNTSKIQILGIDPIINNTDAEVELVFGENMVIGDGVTITKNAEYFLCTRIDHWGVYYYCGATGEQHTQENIQPANWDEMTIIEQIDYQITPEDLGLGSFNEYGEIYASDYDASKDYVDSMYTQTVVNENGAFSGYKLKLTNLENIKYIGWFAFKNSVFNAANQSITIAANQTAGQGAFENTNVKSVTFNNTETSADMFKGCSELKTINFGNLEIVSYGAFENTNLGPSLDFSESNVKKILGGAFRNAGLTSITLDGVEKLGREAFANNDIKELTLPKSINELKDEGVFSGNNNLTKLTIAYDTLTTGTTDPLHAVLGYDIHNNENAITRNIKEVTVIAPYDENEEVSSTHMNYLDYVQATGSTADDPDADLLTYGNINSYKNILGSGYFWGFPALEKVTIGEGYEFIGARAFYANGLSSSNLGGGMTFIKHFKSYLDNGYYTPLTNVSLPESLKGVGFLAFGNHYNPDFTVNLPEALEYIGMYAFYYDIGMHNDIDLPNLKYIGSHAFYIAGVHNVTLHDSLQKIGNCPFMSTYNLHNVTIDFDIYDPDRDLSSIFNGNGYTTGIFGSIYMGSGQEKLEDIPEQIRDDVDITIVVSPRSTEQSYRKLGTIAFTNKVQTPTNINWMFGGTAAEKIDLSKTGWKVIPDNAFVEVVADEILLPEYTESIGSTAFEVTRIKKELVLPNTLKSIGTNAFNNEYENRCRYYYYDDGGYYHFGEKLDLSSGTIPTPSLSHGVKITSLPTSLESIGYAAFYGDVYLTADFNLPNINTIEAVSFFKTSLKDIYLGDNITSIGVGAFTFIPTIQDLVIDLDLFSQSIYSYSFFNGLFTTTPQDEFGYNGQDNYKNITFTNKAVTMPKPGMGAIFKSFTIEKFDMSKTPWTDIPSTYGMIGSHIGEILLPEHLEKIPLGFFYETEAETPIVIPDTVKTIDKYAFQWSNLTIKNGIPEGVETIEDAAFYGAKANDDLVIPNSVKFLGFSSFNAGDRDIEYKSVTIRPNLDYSKTDNQAIFQLFWNAAIDKLIIESEMLPVLGTLQDTPIMPGEIDGPTATGFKDPIEPQELRADGEPEFHGMNVKEVVIRNLPVITDNAFEECAQLTKVDFSDDANLTEIGKYAFNNDTKLAAFEFGDVNNGKDINLKEHAFNNTGLVTVGYNGSGFDLTAAKFNAVEPYVFANIPTLKKVVVPNTFSVFDAANDENGTNGSTVPSFTFADDVELEEVRINYQLSEIKEGSFENDNKIRRFFIWGETTVEESDHADPTIPAPTNILAYSDSPAEQYAQSDARVNYEGKFYPLDEVLYITSNKEYVVLNDDKSDFDKTGLHLYAMRRDGVILESDEWLEYSTAYPRAVRPDIFGNNRGALYDDEEMNVYDAEKPFELVSLTNRNFEATTFELVAVEGKKNPKLLIHYTDGYTVAIRDTAPDTLTREEEEERLHPPVPPVDEDSEEDLSVPNTGATFGTTGRVLASTSIGILSTGIALVIVLKKRAMRK